MWLATVSSDTLTCNYPELLLACVERVRAHVLPVSDADFEGVGQLINIE